MRPRAEALGASLIAGLSILASFVLSGASAAAPAAEYGILVYMVGSDLESGSGAASSDIGEMISGLDEAVTRLALQTGGALAWKNPSVAAKPSSRWLIEGGKLIDKGRPEVADMADPRSLADFVAWGLGALKAKRYVLVLWNHGMGAAGGFGYDEKSGGSLSLSEMARALDDGTMRGGSGFELIGFDACLMATVETASMAAPFAKYLVASQEVEPSHGWDYAAFLRGLSSKPGLDGAGIGRLAADSYKAQAIKEGTDGLLTVSVLKLAAIPALVDALNAAAKGLSTLSPPKNAALRASVREFGEERSGRASSGMVDLLQLLSGAEKELGSKKASGLAAAAKAAVVYSLAGKGRAGSGGISVYFPGAGKDSSPKENAAYAAESGYSPVWKDFLVKYRGDLESETRELSFKPGIKYGKETLEDGETISYYTDEEIDDAFVATVMAPKDQIAEAGIYLSAMEELADGSQAEVIIGIDGNLGRRGVGKTATELEFTWSGEWALLEGQQIALYLEYETDEERLFAMPATVKGVDCDVNVLERLDGDSEDTSFELLEAVESSDEETDVPSKNVFSLRKGDKVIPLFLAIDYEADEEYYVEGEEFRYKGGGIEFDRLPPGEYWINFYVLDFSGNASYSDAISLVIEE
jgi:hypothetical protein